MYLKISLVTKELATGDDENEQNISKRVVFSFFPLFLFSTVKVALTDFVN